MPSRTVPLALLLALVAAVAGCSTPAEEPPARPASLPGSMAALGDSITRAAAADRSRLGDAPAHSWATGGAADDGVDSLYERLRALDPDIQGRANNNAQSGARVGDLARQVDETLRQRPAFVTVLIGANDACARAAPSPDEFRARFREATQALDEGLPADAVIYVVSIPDVTQLRALFGDDPQARATWDAFGVCPAALSAHATQEDIEAFRARLAAYNEAMQEEATRLGFHTDGGAVFAQEVRREDVSTADYFHPSLEGQARLARVAWEAGPYADRAAG